MKTLTKISAAVSIILTITFKVSAQENIQQDIINSLQQIENALISETIQPFADALSSNINSGLYNSAKVSKGFSMNLGVKVSAAPVDQDLLNLFNLDKVKAIQMVHGIPFAVPQLQVGFAGTDAFVRYIPQIDLYGKASVGMWGAGVRHCLTSHFKKSPIDISAQGVYQKMNINDATGSGNIDISSTALNLEISKELGFVTLYTGVQYENTTVTLNYNYQNLITFSKSINNTNKFRATTGIGLALGPVHFNADYNFGKRNTISAGLGFGF